MMPKLLDMVACPGCRSELVFKDAEKVGGEIISGSLFCKKCSREYPIVSGVPCMLLETGKIEDTARGFGELFKLRGKNVFERETLYGWTEQEELELFLKKMGVSRAGLSGKRVLDIGCGIGRLTKNLGLLEAETVGADIQDSIGIAFNECRGVGDAHIVQADIFNLPFQEKRFDYIWCEGVLPYTHDPLLGLKKLAGLLRPGGKIYVMMYTPADIPRFRRIFKGSYRYPSFLLQYIVKVLATVQARRSGSSSRQQFRKISFSLYDALSQKHMHALEPGAVRACLEGCGLSVKEASKSGIKLTAVKG